MKSKKKEEKSPSSHGFSISMNKPYSQKKRMTWEEFDHLMYMIEHPYEFGPTREPRKLLERVKNDC